MLESHKYKIYLLKEAGNLSHVDQVYDNLVERKDWSEAISSLVFLGKFRFKYGSVMDQ